VGLTFEGRFFGGLVLLGLGGELQFERIGGSGTGILEITADREPGCYASQ
jgi:hypothetical protein